MANRILVAEDQADIRELLVMNLRNANYEVLAVADGSAALASQSEQASDLLILDLMMPGMDGVDFFEKVLELSPDVAKRIVFMTGGALTAKSEVFLQTVSNMWIEKPFSNASLAAVIERHLSRTRPS